MEKRQTPHTLTMEGRQRVQLTGVTALVSFNEQMVVLETSEGVLTLLGDGLHVDQLSLQDGRLNVDGSISALEYDGGRRSKGSLLSRLMR